MATEFTGRLGSTTSASGVRNTSETVCRSLSVSNGRDLNSLALAASELAAASRVRPSGDALATAPVASTPPAPARFSTTTGLPSRSCNFTAMARMTTSMLPPGGKDTMKVIGPDG